MKFKTFGLILTATIQLLLSLLPIYLIDVTYFDVLSGHTGLILFQGA